MMENEMNPIGIYDNLNRERIRRLLAIGLFASIITGAGDFLLGYAAEEPAVSFAACIMTGAKNLSDRKNDGQELRSSGYDFYLFKTGSYARH